MNTLPDQSLSRPETAGSDDKRSAPPRTENGRLALIYIDQGMLLAVRGRPVAAARLYRRALRLEPQHVLGHYMLGLALKAMGQAEEARHEWQAALDAPGQEREFGWVRERAAKLLRSSAGSA